MDSKIILNGFCKNGYGGHVICLPNSGVDAKTLIKFYQPDKFIFPVFDVILTYDFKRGE